ncbi:PIN domain-containing protein [Oceaniglobus roseus]|uniref:PIN domain-containing protein n=1 Tax=Oceaniglobus roseus TaxID=1737570 RepID=UPI000C7EF70A|nr:type II toxin-antitoxin system VapC family toxin [Kandeliimicrobium roseum]
MTGLDTNVIVRFLTQDDPAQSALANGLIGSLTAENPGFLSREAMVETVWVLERAYGMARPRIAAALERLLEAEELVIEAADDVGLALHRYGRGGAGFADHMILIAGARAGCGKTFTFDRKAAAAPGRALLA